jgi:hypothetical protein
MVDEKSSMLDEVPLFSLEVINKAVKDSNSNKGFGPDCFDDNILRNLK